MTPDSDPLAQLRDIHLPDAVSFWPPAPGWWVLAALLLAAMGYLLWRWRRRRRLLQPYRQALAELKALRAVPDAAAVSQLLRRVASYHDGSAQPASFTGQVWADYLAAQTGEALSEEQIRLLNEAPYRPLAEADIAPLLEVTDRYLQHCAAQARRAA